MIHLINRTSLIADFTKMVDTVVHAIHYKKQLQPLFIQYHKDKLIFITQFSKIMIKFPSLYKDYM